MEENSIVRDLITKILDETGPTDGSRLVTTLCILQCIKMLPYYLGKLVGSWMNV